MEKVILVINNSVAIVLSSYNGEKYISEQIDSILHQTHKEWQLIIRDDGSIDSTVSIIKEYTENDSRIKLIEDNRGNVGPLKSFEILMEEVLDFEYIFFCDQDDIWLDKKIEISIKEMSKINSDIKLVYTNFEEFEDNSNFKKKVYRYNDINEHKNLIIQNWIYGCTMVINNKLLKLSKRIPEEAINHDNWIANVAQIYGRISYINEITVLHRIHDKNVTTKRENNYTRKIKYVWKIIREKNKNRIEKRIFVEEILKIDKEIPQDKDYINFFYVTLIKKNPKKFLFLYKEKFRGYTPLRTITFYFTIL